VSSPVCVCLLGTLGALCWWPKQESGGAVIWEACRTGSALHKGQVLGRLVNAAVLCQAGACPSREGLQSFHRSWSPAGPDGWESGCPKHSRAQQGLKGDGLGWEGCPSELWDQLQAGVWYGWVAGIMVVVDPAVWPRDGYPGMVWVWKLEAGVAEGQISWWCVDPAQPKRRRSCHMWIWCRAVAWRSPRGGEPSRME
jgi:hypothetical protein